MKITYKHSYKKDNNTYSVYKVRTLLIAQIRKDIFQNVVSDKYVLERVEVGEYIEEGQIFNKWEMKLKTLEHSLNMKLWKKKI